MGIMTATQMANEYGFKSPKSFNKLLAKCGLLTQTKKGHVLAEAHRGNGYIAFIEAPYFLPNGIKAFHKKAVWTESGQAFVHATLLRHGIVPVSEQQQLFNN